MSSTSGSDVSSNVVDHDLNSMAVTNSGIGEYINIDFDQEYNANDLQAIIIKSDYDNLNKTINKIRYVTTNNDPTDISEIQIWRDNSNIINSLGSYAPTYDWEFRRDLSGTGNKLKIATINGDTGYSWTNAGASYNSGLVISSDGSRFIAIRRDTVSPYNQESKVFQINNNTVSQLGSTISGYGFAATITYNGNYIAVSTDAGSNNAKVLKWNNNDWEIVGSEITVSTDSRYLSLSEDGTKLAISKNNKGVYTFEYDGSSWIQLQFIDTGSAYNGRAKLDASGNNIILGNPLGNSERGNLKFYSRSGSSWNLDYTMEDPTTSIDNRQKFGFTYDTNPDQNILISGTGNHPNSSGNTYFVVMVKTNGTWNMRGSKITDSRNGKQTQRFAINNDGTIIAVSNTGINSNGFTENGDIKIYKWDGSSWNQEGDTFYGSSNSENYGFNIDLSMDGKTFIASSKIFDNNKGKIDVYKDFENLFDKNNNIKVNYNEGLTSTLTDGLIFDTSNSKYLSFDNNSIPFQGDYSIEFYANITSFESNSTIFMFGSGSATNVPNISLIMNSSNWDTSSNASLWIYPSGGGSPGHFHGFYNSS